MDASAQGINMRFLGKYQPGLSAPAGDRSFEPGFGIPGTPISRQPGIRLPGRPGSWVLTPEFG
jgi:hypothetical protein